MEDNVKEFSEELESIHNRAMNYCEKADALRKDGKIPEAMQEFYYALIQESVVADTFIESKLNVTEIEPSRSVTCLSCAYIALDCEQEDKARYYASKVVEYNFSIDLVEEAKEILTKC